MCAGHCGRWLDCVIRTRLYEILSLGLPLPLRLYRWNINLQEKLEVYRTLEFSAYYGTSNRDLQTAQNRFHLRLYASPHIDEAEFL